MTSAPDRPVRSDPLTVASVAKAMGILEAFGQVLGDLSLTELVERTGWDKSTVQRFTHTLVKLGYLRKDPRTKRFSLGSPVLDLAYYFLRSDDLIERATPALVTLRNLSGERANLSLYEGTTMVYAIRQQIRREYFDSALIGRRIPVYCSSGGRAALACLTEAESDEVLSRCDIRQRTPKTVTDLSRIRAYVAEARELGYGYALEEASLGEVTVAAAVRDAEGRPVAAVHIAGSLSDTTFEDFRRKCAPLAIEAAQSLSRHRHRP